MQILMLFLIVITLALVSAVGNHIWMSHNHTLHWYLGIFGQYCFGFLPIWLLFCLDGQIWMF